MYKIGADGKNVVSVYGWPKQFQDWPENVDKEVHSGHLLISETSKNVAKMQKLFDALRHLSIRMVVEENGVPKTVSLYTLREVGGGEICPKMVDVLYFAERDWHFSTVHVDLPTCMTTSGTAPL